jgi:hypothetical protein
MTTIARQHPLKRQIRSIIIVSILFVLVALGALFVQNYRALHGASTTSPSRARYFSIPATPGGASLGFQAGRMQNNPFRGFRNVGNVP